MPAFGSLSDPQIANVWAYRAHAQVGEMAGVLGIDAEGPFSSTGTCLWRQARLMGNPLVRAATWVVFFGVSGCGLTEAPGSVWVDRTEPSPPSASAPSGPPIQEPAPPPLGTCSLTVDGKDVPSRGASALLGFSDSSAPTLSVACSTFAVEVAASDGPGRTSGTARYEDERGRGFHSREPSCLVTFERLAIRDRGGLRATFRCEVVSDGLPRATQEAHVIAGTIDLPAKPDFPARIDVPSPTCHFAIAGALTLEGSGTGSNLGCSSSSNVTSVAIPTDTSAAPTSVTVRGTFCPTCSTELLGVCTTTTRESSRDGTARRSGQYFADVVCPRVSYPLGGESSVSAQIEGTIVTPR